MTLTTHKIIELFKRFPSFDRPYHVQWFLTRRCNYRCKSCSVWKDQARDKELSTEEVKAGLDILRKLGVVEIVFSGGNPLLREDIDKILAYASKDFIITIYDNGSMALKKMDALRYADFVAISLDTLDADKNDYIKGVPGAWKNAMEAITKLNEEGLIAVPSITVSQMNLHETTKFTKCFANYGIPVLYSLYSYDNSSEMESFGIGEKNSEFDFTDKKAVARLCDELIKLKKEKTGVLITDKTLIAIKELFLNNRRIWRCKALRKFFVIDHYGRVAGCHLKQPVASIFELPRLWHSSEFERLREKYQKCKECAYLCYVFYSLYPNALDILEIISDQRRNMLSYFMKLSNKYQMLYRRRLRGNFFLTSHNL